MRRTIALRIQTVASLQALTLNGVKLDNREIDVLLSASTWVELLPFRLQVLLFICLNKSIGLLPLSSGPPKKWTLTLAAVPK